MSKNDPIGTKLSGYTPASRGPFACHACIHYKFPHLCIHPDVIKDAKEGRIKLSSNKLAIVDPGGCCTYQRNS